MARARNIKPGFAKNEDLAECSMAARLCFALLPTLADREGRMEDRPKRIKGELFAFDSIDVEPLLVELERHGFIGRYSVEGRGLIQIIAFHKHQNPHHREPESTLPPHPSLRLDADGKWVKPEAYPPSHPPKAPDKPGARPGLDPPRSDLAPPLSRVDSGALIPDSGKETSNLAVAPARPPDDRPPLALVGTPEKPKGPPDCPHLEVLAAWAEILPALPQHDPERWRGAKADHLRTRWRETAVAKGWPDKAHGLAYFRKLFAYVGKSAFLSGRAAPQSPGKRPFVIELEWLVTPANWDKVHEGKYHEEATG